MLSIEPDDHLLEIGAGRGVAVETISSRLGSGTITAIDRSATASDAARARNAAGIASGVVRIETRAIEDAELPAHAFTKAFAINVNVLWVRDPAPNLSLIARALAVGGKVSLFYEPPTADAAHALVRKLKGAIERNGFTSDVRTATTSSEARLVCVIGSPRLGRSGRSHARGE